jgi:hypothetical protein
VATGIEICHVSQENIAPAEMLLGAFLTGITFRSR